MKKTEKPSSELSLLAEFQNVLQDIRESQKEILETIKNLSKDVGGIANSNGEFAEDYFENAFKIEPVFAGQHFSVMQKKLCVADPGIKRKDEFDIVLYNTNTIAIIEIKYKARDYHIGDLIKRLMLFVFGFRDTKTTKFI